MFLYQGSIFRSVNDKVFVPPPPLLKMIFFPPSHDMSFLYSHRGHFALILPYFAVILPLFFLFSHFLSPFFLFLSSFFLFLLHFPPFSLTLFKFFPPNDIGWYFPLSRGGYFPIYRPLTDTVMTQQCILFKGVARVRRKLLVDEETCISSNDMYVQRSDTAGIVTTLQKTISFQDSRRWEITLFWTYEVAGLACQ